MRAALCLRVVGYHDHVLLRYQIGEIAQAIEKVSEQQVKEVSRSAFQHSFSHLTLFQVAMSFLTGKATLVSVGDVFQLPYAEDLGLTV